MIDKEKILKESRDLLLARINKDNTAFGGSNEQQQIDLESYKRNLQLVLDSLKTLKEIGDMF